MVTISLMILTLSFFPSRSEHFVVKWDKLGMPKDLDKLHNLSCLFTVRQGSLNSKNLWNIALILQCKRKTQCKFDS